jgi:hypothetical protein
VPSKTSSQNVVVVPVAQVMKIVMMPMLLMVVVVVGVIVGVLMLTMTLLMTSHNGKYTDTHNCRNFLMLLWQSRLRLLLSYALMTFILAAVLHAYTDLFDR